MLVGLAKEDFEYLKHICLPMTPSGKVEQVPEILRATSIRIFGTTTVLARDIEPGTFLFWLPNAKLKEISI